MQPTDTLIDTKYLKSATVADGAASIQWTNRETEAIWYYVWWTGSISPLGSNAIPGTVTADGGWAFIRSTNCTGDTSNTCDTSSVHRQVAVYSGSSAVLHVWAAPIGDKAATYTQLRAVNDNLDVIYGKLQSVRNDTNDIRYYTSFLTQIHGTDLPALKKSIDDLAAKLDTVAQNQQQQAEADKPAQDNAKEQQTQTENLKKEGDKAKYESDSQAQQDDLNSAADSLKKAFSGDVSLGTACRWDFNADGSRLNLGTLDFCAGEIPPQIQRILSLGLFMMAFQLPVRAVKIFRDAQISARDDASSDKLEKHVEVTS